MFFFRRNKSGFTLIEVIIALSILMGGIILTATMSGGNRMRIRKAQLNVNVATLLERKMTEIEAVYTGKPLEEIPKEDSGDFGEGFDEYSWKLSSQEFEMPDISSVLIGRQEGASELLLTVIKQTQEFISKSVKEVKVSVLVKTPARELEYSVSTYFVDYNKGMSIGGSQ